MITFSDLYKLELEEGLHMYSSFFLMAMFHYKKSKVLISPRWDSVCYLNPQVSIKPKVTLLRIICE